MVIGHCDGISQYGSFQRIAMDDREGRVVLFTRYSRRFRLGGKSQFADTIYTVALLPSRDEMEPVAAASFFDGDDAWRYMDDLGFHSA